MRSEKFPLIQQEPFENKMLKETVRENINKNFKQLFNAVELIQDEIESGHTGCSGGNGGGSLVIDNDTLRFIDGVLSVNTVNVMGDYTQPITAAAVYTEVGNIQAILKTI